MKNYKAGTKVQISVNNMEDSEFIGIITNTWVWGYEYIDETNLGSKESQKLLNWLESNKNAENKFDLLWSYNKGWYEHMHQIMFHNNKFVLESGWECAITEM